MKKSFKWIAVLMLGFVLGFGSFMLLPAPEANAVPPNGSWAEYYGRCLVGGWSTDCDGNYTSWGTVTNDVEYGQDMCP